MPTIETLEGKVVDVTPVDPDAVNNQFDRVMADDGPDTQYLPRRGPAAA